MRQGRPAPAVLLLTSAILVGQLLVEVSYALALPALPGLPRSPEPAHGYLYGHSHSPNDYTTTSISQEIMDAVKRGLTERMAEQSPGEDQQQNLGYQSDKSQNESLIGKELAFSKIFLWGDSLSDNGNGTFLYSNRTWPDVPGYFK